MEIINESPIDVTWWCYNSNDSSKTWDMGHGNLAKGGGRVQWDPADNLTGRYYVKFTILESGGIPAPLRGLVEAIAGPTLSGVLANCAAVPKNGKVTFRRSPTNPDLFDAKWS